MNILYKVTLQSLKKNKVRTLVTIIGIILSAAMFTAVTTSISSVRNYMVESVIAEDGNWHGIAFGLSDESFKTAIAREDIKDFGGVCEYGYIRIEDAKKNGTEPMECRNASKPYLLMSALACDKETAEELFHFTLLAGRMPENEQEILVPEHLAYGGVYLKIGDTITGSIGQREYMGETLASDRYYKEADEKKNDPGESLVGLEDEKTYTVVGIYERFNYYIENHSCPGYMVLAGVPDPVDTTPGAVFHLVYSLREKKDIFAVDEAMGMVAERTSYHSDLLRMDGISGMSAYSTVFVGLGVILCAIIVFGSVALIYNAFSISVNERIKQFGLLASVGATKRQRKKSIMFEACVVSAAGIPLGILAGIVGMGITFYALRYRFTGILNDAKIPLTLNVEWWAVAIAAVLAFLTVLISAAIPARKAMRIPVIEAIRQNNEIRVPGKKRNTSGFLYKLFGMEGALADKNFRRNRRKYRATVVSLFVSIVLFISASSFVDYLKTGINATVQAKNYDFQYYTYSAGNGPAAEEVLQLLAGTEGIAESSIVTYETETYLFQKEALSKELIDWIEARGYLYYDNELYQEQFGDGKMAVQIRVGFLTDEDYRAYTDKNGLTDKGYFGGRKNALVYDNIRKYLNGKYLEVAYLKEKSGTITLLPYELRNVEITSDNGSESSQTGGKQKDAGTDSRDKNLEDEGRPEEDSIDTGENAEDMDQTGGIPSAESSEYLDGLEDTEYRTCLIPGVEKQISYYVTDAPTPLGVDKNELIFLYPESALPELFPEITEPVRTVNITVSGDTGKIYETMEQKLIAGGISTGQFYNIAEQDMFERNLLLIINVFSFGFITLISLIAAANVFNTISTNISLRRREFAMLESIGMTKSGLYKMLNYECLLYGIKSLAYGIPVSLLVTFMIYQVVNEGFITNFYVPAVSIAIAVASVFAVVFATMFYAAGKLRRNSVVETLKNENI